MKHKYHLMELEVRSMLFIIIQICLNWTKDQLDKGLTFICSLTFVQDLIILIMATQLYFYKTSQILDPPLVGI